MYSLSTFIDDTLQKDEFGRGFFAFIVEPDPSEATEVIDKVFTLIIDKSGSMSGEKIIQAENSVFRKKQYEFLASAYRKAIELTIKSAAAKRKPK